MKIFGKLGCIASLFVFVLAPGLDRAWSAEPLQTNCHMDACSWSKELSRDFVGSTAKGTLYELLMLGGSSTHRNGSYERKQPISWSAKPTKSYVFCSKTLPMVMGRYNGEFQFDFLQIGRGVIGAYLSSLSLYAYVCHNVQIKDEISFAKSFGYRPALSEFEGIQSQIAGPDDILRQ
jgi:hypothetical protein